MSPGEILRSVREKRGMTLKDVAEHVGVSVAFVCDVELGRRPLTLERLPRFAKALKLTPAATVPLYQAAGVLPESVVRSVLRNPSLWGPPFHGVKGEP